MFYCAARRVHLFFIVFHSNSLSSPFSTRKWKEKESEREGESAKLVGEPRSTSCTPMTKNNTFCFCHTVPSPIRGKLEKERREKAKQLGLIRTEGSDGGEDMERERRTFQLQMCEVGDECQSKYQAQTSEVGLIYFTWVVYLVDSVFRLRPNAQPDSGPSVAAAVLAMEEIRLRKSNPSSPGRVLNDWFRCFLKVWGNASRPAPEGFGEIPVLCVAGYRWWSSSGVCQSTCSCRNPVKKWTILTLTSC